MLENALEKNETCFGFSIQDEGRPTTDIGISVLRQTMPVPTTDCSERVLKGVCRFLCMYPQLADNSILSALLCVLRNHENQDVRYHVATAAGSCLANLPVETGYQEQKVLIEMLQGAGDCIDEVMVAVAYVSVAKNGILTQVPKELTACVQAVNGTGSLESLLYSGISRPVLLIILERLSKYLGPMVFGHPKFQDGLSLLGEGSVGIDSSEWRGRALFFDRIKHRCGLSASLEELYFGVVTDPVREVQYRGSRALACLVGESTQSANAWARRLVKDLNVFSEQALRYIAGIVPVVLANSDCETAHNLLGVLVEMVENSSIPPYTRKTALKILSKTTTSEFLSSYREIITELVVGCITDDSVEVRDEALSCLTKRIQLPPTPIEIKEKLEAVLFSGDWESKRQAIEYINTYG